MPHTIERKIEYRDMPDPNSIIAIYDVITPKQKIPVSFISLIDPRTSKSPREESMELTEDEQRLINDCFSSYIAIKAQGYLTKATVLTEPPQDGVNKKTFFDSKRIETLVNYFIVDEGDQNVLDVGFINGKLLLPEVVEIYSAMSDALEGHTKHSKRTVNEMINFKRYY